MPQFPKTLVINLDRDKDRLFYMTKQLGDLGIVFERLPAIWGDEVPQNLRKNFFDEKGNNLTPLKKGEIGCYSSHLAIFNAMIDGQLPPMVLVLEDDIGIDSDFVETLNDAISKLPNDWDILRLSNHPKRTYVIKEKLINERNLIIYSIIPNGTGAYLINLSGAKKLANDDLRTRAIDNDMRDEYKYRLNSYGIVPAPIMPDVLTSTIDSMTPGRKKKHRRNIIEKIATTIDGTKYFSSRVGFKNWLLCLIYNIAQKFIKRTNGKSKIHDFSKSLSNLKQIK